jgi:hypothetical protein
MLYRKTYTHYVLIIKNKEVANEYFVRPHFFINEIVQILTTMGAKVELADYITIIMENDVNLYSNPAMSKAEKFRDFVYEKFKNRTRYDDFGANWINVESINKDELLKEFEDYNNQKKSVNIVEPIFQTTLF